jgi:hypothetical protein
MERLGVVRTETISMTRIRWGTGWEMIFTSTTWIAGTWQTQEHSVELAPRAFCPDEEWLESNEQAKDAHWPSSLPFKHSGSPHQNREIVNTATRSRPTGTTMYLEKCLSIVWNNISICWTKATMNPTSRTLSYLCHNVMVAPEFADCIAMLT